MGHNPIARRFNLVTLILISLPGLLFMIIGILLLIPAILSQVTTVPLDGLWQLLAPFVFSLGAFLLYLPRYIDWLAKRMDVTASDQPDWSQTSKSSAEQPFEDDDWGNQATLPHEEKSGQTRDTEQEDVEYERE